MSRVGGALLEEQHHRLDARALEGARRAIEDRVKRAGLQQLAAERHRGVVAVAEKGVLDDHRRPAAGAQLANEMLQEEIGGLT